MYTDHPTPCMRDMQLERTKPVSFSRCHWVGVADGFCRVAFGGRGEKLPATTLHLGLLINPYPGASSNSIIQFPISRAPQRTSAGAQRTRRRLGFHLGLFNEQVGRDFVTKVHCRGNSTDPMQLFTDFMGRPPDLSARLLRAGLA